MKKKTLLLWIIAVLFLATVVLASIRVYRHEKDQTEALRELKEQILSLQEAEKNAEEVTALKDRISALEARADYAECDYLYFPLGNSITVHAPNEVWWNETGMAASDTSHDFVHLVAAELSKDRGKVACRPFYFYAWETAKNRAETLTLLDPYLDPQLNLITVQLGENAEDLTTFEQDFEALLRYIQEKAPRARILVIDDFWTHGDRSRMKQSAAEHTGAEFISLEGIRDRAEYQAGLNTPVFDSRGNPHLIENADVASHPGDSGMREIANRILNVLKAEP